MPNKDPLIVSKVVVSRWWSIETENGTNILSVSSTGTVTQTAAAGGTTPINSFTNFWAVSWPITVATTGTDTAGTADRLMVTKIFIPCTTTITGLAYLIGSVWGTDKAVVSMYTSAWVLVANSAIAWGWTTVGTAANFQALNFLTAYTAIWPARYRVGVNVSGTTCKVRTYAIPWAWFFTGLLTQTTGTPANITPPTTYTANYAPFIHTY